jgi:hypothetical protein
LRHFFNSPFAEGIEHVREFTVPVTGDLPMRLRSSHLHVHDPDELTFDEQNPITIGGPGDLTQTAFPPEVDPRPSGALASVIGVLFVLS